MKHILPITAALTLTACASVFDAQPANTVPPAPAPAQAARVAPPPPPPPPTTPVDRPYPAPAAPVIASEPPALSAGPVHAAQPTMLRARPQAQATVEAHIPAGATLTLRVRQSNSDGAWWFTEYQGTTGWVSERGLTP